MLEVLPQPSLQEQVEATRLDGPLSIRTEDSLRLHGQTELLSGYRPLASPEQVAEVLRFELGSLQAVISLPASPAIRPLTHSRIDDMHKVYLFDLGAATGRHNAEEEKAATTGRHRRPPVDEARYLVMGSNAIRQVRQHVADGMPPEQALERGDIATLATGQSIKLGTRSWLPAVGTDIDRAEHDAVLKLTYN